MHGITTPPQFSGQSGSACADDVTTPNLPGHVFAMAISAPKFLLLFTTAGWNVQPYSIKFALLAMMTLLESRIFLSILGNCYITQILSCLANFIVSDFIPSPSTRESKKHLEVAVIEPGPAALKASSEVGIHYTTAY